MAFRQIEGGEGSDVWVEADKNDSTNVWTQATLLAQTGPLVTVRQKAGGRVQQVDLRTKAVEPANPSVEADMTALHHIHEAGILHNLRERCEVDEPYTFMGSVLVAVNPLKRIPDPVKAGKPSVANMPHPYAVAETAYQQMSFAWDKRRKRSTGSEDSGNQSVITGGESGAGKTESSKMVLRHLVARSAQRGSSGEIDKRLLGSNPITEAFGNAATLRNHNSSRFGKLLKLHFTQIDTPNDKPASWEIVAGSVETYLLERSRVTLHGRGERNFHIFYSLLNCGDSTLLKTLALDQSKKGFQYLTPHDHLDNGGHSAKENIKSASDGMHGVASDKKAFVELLGALDAIGMAQEERNSMFRVVAAIMHLGNAHFKDKETNEGDVAIEAISSSGNGYSGLEHAAKLLGVTKVALTSLLTERVVHARSETLIVKRNARASLYARDAVAKGLYSKLFDWVIARIDRSLDDSGTAHGQSVKDLPFTGVLDIFGFESFTRNDFEQLLINFCNSALQKTFNTSVFIGELKLYQDEGLVLDETLAPPPDNSATMQLLTGNPNAKDQYEKRGLLLTIVSEGENIDPNDTKMNDRFHRSFGKHPSFVRPHPKDRGSTFIVFHYAGKVTYTIGSFLEKNADDLPMGAPQVFAKSELDLVQGVFQVEVDKANRAAASGGRSKKPKGTSVVRKFRAQIDQLVRTLESTRCSFIRCVKPNAEMERHKGWFNVKYVSQQLRCLSIPQTAEVLKAGLPTRIAYSNLVSSYKTALPKSAVEVWQKMGQGNNKAFVSALFWAFEVERSTYKLGHTRVFFKSGQLSQLDHILQQASEWSNSSDSKMKKERQRIAKRFRLYYIRLIWRRAYIKVVAVNRFLRLLDGARKRSGAAIRVQSFLRMVPRRIQYNQAMKAKRRAALLEADWARYDAEEKAREEQAAKEDFDDNVSSASEHDERVKMEEQKLETLTTAIENEKQAARLTSRERASQRRSGRSAASVAAGGTAAGEADVHEDDEAARAQKLAKTIMEEAAAAEQRDFDRSSIKPNESERRNALRMYEEHYAKKMAEYEVARFRFSKIQAGVQGLSNVLTDLWQQVVKGMNPSNLQESMTNIRTQFSNLMDADRRNADLKKILDDWKAQWTLMLTARGRTELLKQWDESLRRSRLRFERRQKKMMDLALSQPWYQSAVNQVDKIKQQARENRSGSVDTSITKGLRKFFVLNDFELRRPFRSAEKQILRLTQLRERGVITPDEFASLMADISLAVEPTDFRPSSTNRRPQVVSISNVQVTCRNCGTVGNTGSGPLCRKCHVRLPVLSDYSHSEDNRSDWFKELVYMEHGTFKARLDGSRSVFNPQDITYTVLFEVECLWVGSDPVSGAMVFESWRVARPWADFAKLDAGVNGGSKAKKMFNTKQARSAVRKLAETTAMGGTRAVASPSLSRIGSGRGSSFVSGMSSVGLLRRISTSKAMVKQDDGTRVSVGERTDQLRAWLGLVFEAASLSKMPKATKKGTGDRNAFLQASFVDSFFEISRHVSARHSASS